MSETLEISDKDVSQLPRLDAPAIIADFRTQLGPLFATAETLTVTDANDHAGIEFAQATMKAIAKWRIALEKKRKELGEEALRRKQRIDDDARPIRDKCEALEARLKEQAEFAIRQAQARIEQRDHERAQRLREIDLDPMHFNIAAMADDQFEDWFADQARAAHLLRTQKEAEAAAFAKQQEAYALERERIRVENERLQAEAREREAQMAKERADMQAKLDAERRDAEVKLKAQQDAQEAARRVEAEKARKAKEAADAELAKEREARAAIERQAEMVRQQQAAEQAQQAEIARKAAQAPDREKLIEFASRLACLQCAEMSSEAGQVAKMAIMAKVSEMSSWVERKAEAL